MIDYGSVPSNKIDKEISTSISCRPARYKQFHTISILVTIIVITIITYICISSSNILRGSIRSEAIFSSLKTIFKYNSYKKLNILHISDSHIEPWPVNYVTSNGFCRNKTSHNNNNNNNQIDHFILGCDPPITLFKSMIQNINSIKNRKPDIM